MLFNRYRRGEEAREDARRRGEAGARSGSTRVRAELRRPRAGAACPTCEADQVITCPTARRCVPTRQPLAHPLGRPAATA